MAFTLGQKFLFNVAWLTIFGDGKKAEDILLQKQREYHFKQLHNAVDKLNREKFDLYFQAYVNSKPHSEKIEELKNHINQHYGKVIQHTVQKYREIHGNRALVGGAIAGTGAAATGLIYIWPPELSRDHDFSLNYDDSTWDALKDWFNEHPLEHNVQKAAIVLGGVIVIGGIVYGVHQFNEWCNAKSRVQQQHDSVKHFKEAFENKDKKGAR